MIEKEEGRKDDSIERAYNLWCTGVETLYFALKRIVIFYRLPIPYLCSGHENGSNLIHNFYLFYILYI
jgi:hypothetical protein